MTGMRAAKPYALAPTRRRTGVDVLSRRLTRVGLDGVLRDLDRAAEPCPVPGAAAGDGLTWDDYDRNDAAWWPQGVATLRSGGVLIVSWYAKRRRLRTPGARISVLDRRHPDGPRYRHVLLVAPRRLFGILTVGVVPVHAGGIAVRNDLLYVADTLFGLRIFRLDDILRNPGRPPGRAAPSGRGRLGGLRGHGRVGRRVDPAYDYVLPQLMAFRVPLFSQARRFRYSFLSIGEVEGRPNLVVGEYRRAGHGPPRLARYPLDDRTGLPATGESGRCPPLQVYEDQPARMQGAAVHGSDWFLTASAGEATGGDLYVGSPGALHRHRRVLPSGPEDLDWSRPGQELWCVSEWPGRRWISPISTSRWRRPPAARTGAGP